MRCQNKVSIYIILGIGKIKEFFFILTLSNTILTFNDLATLWEKGKKCTFSFLTIFSVLSELNLGTLDSFALTQ